MIQARLEQIQKNIEDVQPIQTVLCLAVSKGQSAQQIQEAYACGLTAFAENYLQEAMLKIEALKSLPLTWHYIGRIQTRKCAKLAAYFSWVQTIESIEQAVKLNAANQTLQKTQNVCIQVNLLGEQQKGGLKPEGLHELISQMQGLGALKLRGLMTILAQGLRPEEQFGHYLKLHKLLSELNQNLGLAMDTLSMGMSDDYLAAVRAGSTMIRIGTALFGPRV